MLSRPDILEYITSGKLVFDPPVGDDAVAQVSVDLRLGRKFSILKEPPNYITSIRVDPSLWASTDLWEHLEQQESFCLRPGSFVLAQTLEKVSIPNDLVGLVEGRSSWARIGVTIHITAPKIDPGFSAPITLELANLGRVPVELRAVTDKPAQLMLFKLSTPLPESDLYGTSGEDRFQGQIDPIPYRPPGDSDR